MHIWSPRSEGDFANLGNVNRIRQIPTTIRKEYLAIKFSFLLALGPPTSSIGTSLRDLPTADRSPHAVNRWIDKCSYTRIDGHETVWGTPSRHIFDIANDLIHRDLFDRIGNHKTGSRAQKAIMFGITDTEQAE